MWRGSKLLILVGLLLCFGAFPIHATSLLQALRQAGASQFAALIESDPDAFAIYSSQQVRTVFAPIDGARNVSSASGNASVASGLRRRQSSAASLQAKLYQSTSNLNSLGAMSVGSGLVMQSNDKSSSGKSREIASTPRSANQNTCNPAEQKDVVHKSGNGDSGNGDSGNCDSGNCDWHISHTVYVTITERLSFTVTVTDILTLRITDSITINDTLTIDNTVTTEETVTVKDTATVHDKSLVIVTETIIKPSDVNSTVTDTVTVTIATPSEVDITHTKTDTVTETLTTPFEVDVTVTKTIVSPSDVRFTITDMIIATPPEVDVTVTETDMLLSTVATPSRADVTVIETNAFLSIIATPSEVDVVSTEAIANTATIVTPSQVDITISETRTISSDVTLLTATTATITHPGATVITTISGTRKTITIPPTTVLAIQTTTVLKIVTTPTTVPPSAVATTEYTTVATDLRTVESSIVLPSTPPSLLKISSGIGNQVNIVEADIPYDGGIIHIIDDYFTLPKGFVDTANTNGQTAFTGLISSFGLTDRLNNAPEMTYFIPTNDALSVQGATSHYQTIQGLILGHVVPNFVGYLPSLMNNTTFTSQGGSKFTVTTDGCNHYVNNAKIILPNVVLENGVAHVVDQVIQPLSPQIISPSQPPNSGSSSFKSSHFQSSLLLLISGLLL